MSLNDPYSARSSQSHGLTLSNVSLAVNNPPLIMISRGNMKSVEAIEQCLNLDLDHYLPSEIITIITKFPYL